MLKLIFLFKRKPGSTPEQFRDYYENSHVPLAIRLLPYFRSYQRNYIDQAKAYSPSGIGAQVDHDVVTELTFESQADFDRMMAAMGDPAIMRQIIADEENFMDRSPGARQMFFVDEQNTPAAKLREFA